MAPPIPLAYLITFTCFGTRLYGDEAGSVDREHNRYGSPMLAVRPRRVQALQERMKHLPYKLDSRRRDVVLEALREVCLHRNWKLLAAHVRSTHVHVVVAAELAPERILTELKAYASRALNRSGRDKAETKRWARHGSTRYLWKPAQVRAAMEYVVHEQGRPMAVWWDERRA